MHYRRFKANGDSERPPRPTEEERFSKWITLGEPDECWPWIGGADGDGYGMYYLSGKSRRAHRVAWERANGPITGGLHVLHRCDNPPCCNPTHLFLGTIADNNRDRSGKGRWVGNPDPWASQRRLTADQIVEIRQFGNPYRGARRELAARYGVSYQHIRAIQLDQRR